MEYTIINFMPLEIIENHIINGIDSFDKYNLQMVCTFFYKQVSKKKNTINTTKEFKSACFRGDYLNIRYISKELNEAYLIGDTPRRKHISTVFNWNTGLCEASRGGNMRIVDLMLQKNAKNFNRALIESIIGNNEKIAQRLIQLGAKNISECLGVACKTGNLINFCIANGSTHFNLGLLGACCGGNVKSLKAMINLGARNFNFGLQKVSQSEENQLECAKFLVTEANKYNIPLDFDIALTSACRFGTSELVQYIVDCGGTCFDSGLYEACVGEKLENIKLMISNGAYDLQHGFWKVFCNGNFDIMNFLYKRGIEINYSFNMEKIITSSYYEIDIKRFTFLVDKMRFDNWDFAIKYACQKNDKNLVEYIVNKDVITFDEIFETASIWSTSKILKLLINHKDYNDKIDLNYGLQLACIYGNLQNVKFFIRNGANNAKKYFKYACMSENKQLVYYMIEIDECDLNKGLRYALKNIDIDIIDILIDNGADYIDVYENAVKGEHHNIMLMLMNKMIDIYEDVNEGLMDGCYYGCVDLVNEMINRECNDWEGGFRHACISGHLHIAKLMIEKGAKNFQIGYNEAVKNDMLYISQWIIDIGYIVT